MNINLRGQRLLQGYDFLQSQSDTRPIKVLLHECVQAIVFQPFPQDSELQVERLLLASSIYESIGFKRKAAFYKRFAALKAVVVQSDWQACYDSLIESIEGFGLTLDPIDYEKALISRTSSVWPGLHVQLLEELITCCKKVDTAQSGTLTMRHMSFMLHSLESYLTATKKRELARELEESSTRFGEDSPVALTLSSGYVVPAVNLTKYPTCLKLEPLPLGWSLRPYKLQQLRRRSELTPAANEKPDNPFIFTPITNHSSLTILDAGKASDTVLTDIIWVQDEPCSTKMVLQNPLPIELKVSSVKLLTDGVPIETKPYNLVMQSDPAAQSIIKLIGIPRHLPKAKDDSKPMVNRLEIFGYSTHLLGVKSNCRLDMLTRKRFPHQYIVEVCPPLPRIEFQFLDETRASVADHIPFENVDRDLIALDIRTHLKLNEKLVATLTISNPSTVEITYMYIYDKHQPLFNSSQSNLVSWDDERLAQLASNPLKAGQKLDLAIELNASQDLFQSSDSLSKCLTFEYSGGIALKELYCRRCTIRFSVNVIEVSDNKEKRKDVDEAISEMAIGAPTQRAEAHAGESPQS